MQRDAAIHGSGPCLDWHASSEHASLSRDSTTLQIHAATQHGTGAIRDPTVEQINEDKPKQNSYMPVRTRWKSCRRGKRSGAEVRALQEAESNARLNQAASSILANSRSNKRKAASESPCRDRSSLRPAEKRAKVILSGETIPPRVQPARQARSSPWHGTARVLQDDGNLDDIKDVRDQPLRSEHAPQLAMEETDATGNEEVHMGYLRGDVDDGAVGLGSEEGASRAAGEVGFSPNSSLSTSANNVLVSKATAGMNAPRSAPQRKKTISPYFSTSQSPEKRSSRAFMPIPPLAATRFGIIQETFAHDPWRLFLAVIFLNRTAGLAAVPILYNLLHRWPDAHALAAADMSEVSQMIQCLGLQNQRAKKIIELSKMWIVDPPRRGVRHRRLNYPMLADGADIKAGEVIADDVDDARKGWEAAHLPGVGDYALDSWRIFCRDVLRGVASNHDGKNAECADFEPEWKRVVPQDKELRVYLQWKWLCEGWQWSPLTGKRKRASEEVMSAAAAGTFVWESLNKDGTITVMKPGQNSVEQRQVMGTGQAFDVIVLEQRRRDLETKKLEAENRKRKREGSQSTALAASSASETPSGAADQSQSQTPRRASRATSCASPSARTGTFDSVDSATPAPRGLSRVSATRARKASPASGNVCSKSVTRSAAKKVAASKTVEKAHTANNALLFSQSKSGTTPNKAVTPPKLATSGGINSQLPTPPSRRSARQAVMPTVDYWTMKFCQNDTRSREAQFLKIKA